MKKLFALLLACCMLCGCTAVPVETTVSAEKETQPPMTDAPDFQLAGDVVQIDLRDQDITVSGDGSGVYTSRDIVYYEDKTEYDSGNPYGEGDDWERHSAEEAGEHLVVNITAPGNYRLSGRLNKGQIRIDLGEDAYEDPNAVVNLILDGVDITCEVGPAILFQNVYECDGEWAVDTAKPDVDTTAAGANLILAEGSENTVTGSHVAKIFKDKEGEKKLWKQDGAVYSYMSMNVYGPGALDIHADNEGLDTELHLTILGGDINIYSGNDGINTNEDGVSVTAIHGGNLHITAGLREEGDGIDSNGYLVIYGGIVVAAAHPAADAGLDSDLGSYIHGGTVIALGSAMDWAESDSEQVTINLQFAQQQNAGSAIVIDKEDGSVVFEYDPSQDAVMKENLRTFQGMIVSCPEFQVGDTYEVFLDGVKMAYTGTDVMRHPGGMPPAEGGQPPQGDMGMPGDQAPGEMPQPPEGGFGEPPQGGEGMPPMPDGEMPSMPEGEFPQDGQMPPEGFGGGPGGPGDFGGGEAGEKQTLFFMQDKVNFFSGLTEAE
ncbi:MAG: carbohydrate-binding domain-containing protein [Oscillospiraceae bacterium]|nr:carbohydrate-binding domain-containing protein [Oscillospiraceae bacterium]